ncbi:MAG: mandelate racemase/muconate lactonizing enzyme family protein [Alphaproteobacteria bacterium]
MRLRHIRVYCVRIPLVDGFAHSATSRTSGDSVIVRVETDDGSVGYGEGAPRPYVTGESPETVVRHIIETYRPRLERISLPTCDSPELLDDAAALLDDGPEPRAGGILAHHAARSAMELALLDCCLRGAGRSLAQAVPVRRKEIRYSGVLPMANVERTIRYARQMRLAGLAHVKVKVGDGPGIERVAAVREVLGPEASIRVDANGAWTRDQALRQLEAMAVYAIECCEEPIGRQRMSDLPALTRSSPVPIMLDESLVTLDDAGTAAERGACHLFNLRVSKCGGIGRTLEFVDVARAHGLGFQIGAHVGETSILSAAGRHLAASLPDCVYLEGSYGTLLLCDDVTNPSLRFGHGGRAPLLKGPGLGVDVDEPRLERYAVREVDLT